jgi:hypothetical protein
LRPVKLVDNDIIALMGRQVLTEISEFHRAELRAQTFQPFYERIPNLFPIPFVLKLLISILLGFAFLGPHFWVVGELLLTDWSWLLALIIAVAMMGLYYATHCFRSMFPQLNVRLKSQDAALIDEAYFSNVRYYLSDRMFVLTGLFFAASNCLVAYILDPSYDNNLAMFTIYLGFAISGFVCGMAVCGIRGVVVALNNYFKSNPRVDYTNPDKCGGFLFFGDALIIFAGVTLIVGLLISLYIVEFLWTSAGTVPILSRIAMWMWIALPFILSLTILLAPASCANRALMTHKIQKEVELAIAIDKAKDALAHVETDMDRKDELRQEIEYHDNLRAQLHSMRVWPFNGQSNIKAVVLFVSNAYVAITSIGGLLTGD